MSFKWIETKNEEVKRRRWNYFYKGAKQRRVLSLNTPIMTDLDDDVDKGEFEH